MDRLITKGTPEGTLNYTYDAAGHLVSMTSTHTNGVSVSYTYDGLNRLQTVVDSRLSGNQTTTYTYDDASNVATVTYPNSVQTALSYDQLNRLKQLATSQTGYLYAFDNAGNRKTGTELSGRTSNWTYDGINRLTNETISLDPNNKNGSVGYGLDPVGNRQTATSSISGLSPVGGTFNADDELAGESYDSNGNVTASGGKTFSYDTENQLVSVNGGAITIVYDGDGNRVRKVANGITTQYLVDDLNPTGYAQVVEELVGGAVTRQYAYGLQRISQNQVVSNTWTPSFYGYDGLGTVRQLTNSGGTITDTYEFDAWGNEVNQTGTTPNSYLYRGEQFDMDLGLYYLRARYYNTVTSRFMSRDPEDGNPINPATLHKYIYAGSNPIKYVDPTGRDLFSYAIRSNAAIPEAKLISIYGCVADASLAAADLILDPEISAGSALGAGSTVIGCVLLTPGIGQLADQGVKNVKRAVRFIRFVGKASGWGSCALDAEDFVNGLNDLATGKPAGKAISKSIENLGGCVGDLLGEMLKDELED